MARRGYPPEFRRRVVESVRTTEVWIAPAKIAAQSASDTSPRSTNRPSRHANCAPDCNGSHRSE